MLTTKESTLHLNQKGYLLIENLVAIAIIAVGMLGVSSMQITALKSGQGAVERGKVSLITASMTDRMRSNTLAVLSGAYSLTATSTPPAYNNTANSPDIVASNDHNLWLNEIIDSLSSDISPTAGINCVGRSCTLSVQWSRKHARTDTEIEHASTTAPTAQQNFSVTAIF